MAGPERELERVPSPAGSRDRRRYRDAAVAAILFFVVVALFAPAVRFSFLPFDDDTDLLENPPIRNGIGMASVRWSFGFQPGYHYYPLTWLSHALDFTLFGDDPAGHHAVNVVLHAGATALLYLFLSSATSACGASALVAALFGVHPLRSESVAWVAERKDTLSVFLALLVLLLYARWAHRLTGARRAGLTAVFLAGLLAKQMLVSVPILLLLLDVWPLRRLPSGAGTFARLWALVREKIPLFGLAAMAAVGAVVEQRDSGALASLEASPPLQRAATWLYACFWYVWKTVLPAGLSIFYPLRPLRNGEVWAGAMTVVLLGALALHRRVHPSVRIGVLWYLAALFPVSGAVRIGDQLVADRYSYLPTIGLLVAAVFGLRSLIPHDDRRVLAAAAAGSAVVGVSFALATATDLGRFHDGLTVFSSAAAVEPNNWLAHLKVGDQLVQLGRVNEAVRAYAQALRARPGWEPAAGGLAQGLMRTGRTGDALAVIDDGLRRNPSSEWLHRLGAFLYERAGKPREARALSRRADELQGLASSRPGDPALYKALRELRGHYRSAAPAAPE